uniref:Uncharacterized protein n=1 Tax=Plectus sambesii TaxID=2011161 RepID=A0A914V2D3_9BILA
MSSSQPIQLDTVVLQNCAFNLHYFDRIYQEAVNRRFAIAIRATYPTDQISVRIHCPEVCDINVVDDDEADQLDDDYLNSIEYQISGPKKRQLINQRDKKSLYGRENLRKGVQAILRRFKHFRKLRLTGYFGKTATESILLALNQPKCFPLSLSAIYFKVKKDVLIDFVLIEALASLIKKLTFVGTSERLNWTDDIWLSVANCTQLHSLDYRQETDLIDTELERMQTNLQKCLKTLQIERFRYDLPPMESFSVFDSNWIYESLKENMALRNLQISNTCQSAHINGSVIRYLLTMPLNVVSWADSTLLPIVGRLRELQVTDEPLHEVEDALKAKPGDMINLLRVKNESGVPLIITYLTYLSCGHSLQLILGSRLDGAAVVFVNMFSSTRARSRRVKGKDEASRRVASGQRGGDRYENTAADALFSTVYSDYCSELSKSLLLLYCSYEKLTMADNMEKGTLESAIDRTKEVLHNAAETTMELAHSAAETTMEYAHGAAEATMGYAHDAKVALFGEPNIEDEAAEKVRDAADTVADKVSDAREKVADTAHDAKRKGRKMRKNAGNKIQGNH